MILRARILLPVSQPPLENGAVVIRGDRILSIGPWHPSLQVEDPFVVDLGEVVLLPGFVNAHCHLDYTGMAGQIAPGRSFVDWIMSINALKASWGIEDYQRSWLRGAQMLLQHGTTTVADMETVPAVLPAVSCQTPLRLFSFLELIGIRNTPSAEDLLSQVLDAAKLPEGFAGRLGLSPHAPYSTTPELLQWCARIASEKGWRLSTHVAESEAEFDMFMHRRGPMFDWLKKQRDMTDCGLGSPVQHLEKSGLLRETLLAAHVNYLWHEDAKLLGQRQVSVVHCPRSHAYFGHRAFPHPALMAAGVNICLGTDSLATVKARRGNPIELNMFAEMQALAATTSVLSAQTVIRMATLNGARALGLNGTAGELAPGAWADMIAIPYNGMMTEVYEAIVHHPGGVAASMIGGVWAVPPARNEERRTKN